MAKAKEGRYIYSHNSIVELAGTVRISVISTSTMSHNVRVNTFVKSS